MPYLLNIVYLLLVTLLSPYLLLTAIRKGKYRSGLMQKWFGLVPPRQGGCLQSSFKWVRLPSAS